MTEDKDSVGKTKIAACGCASDCQGNCKCGNGWWATFVFPPHGVGEAVRSPLDRALDNLGTKRKEVKTLPNGKTVVKVFLGKNKDEAKEYLKKYQQSIKGIIKPEEKPLLAFEPRNDSEFVLYKGEYLSAFAVESIINLSNLPPKVMLPLLRMETASKLEEKYGKDYTGTGFFEKLMQANEDIHSHSVD